MSLRVIPGLIATALLDSGHGVEEADFPAR